MSGFIAKIMPTRTERDIKVITDLDQLLTETVAFRFNGKIYELKPVDTETFMRMADTLGKIQTLIRDQGNGKEVSADEIYSSYHEYISNLCPQVTKEMLMRMTLPQVHALLNLVIKQCTGQPMNMDKTAEKKKMS